MEEVLTKLQDLKDKASSTGLSLARMKLSSISDTCVHCNVNVIGKDGWATTGSRGIVGIEAGETVHYNVCKDCVRK